MTLFDAYLAVDWSARSEPTPKAPRADAVWVGERVLSDDGALQLSEERYCQTRLECLVHLRERLREHKAAGRRVFIGFDFAYGYPAGYTELLGLQGDAPWRLIWNELAVLIDDLPSGWNNRFVVAGRLNTRCGGEPPGPFWGRPASQEVAGLSTTRPRYSYQLGSGLALQNMRETENLLPGVLSTWQLFGAGAVGGQTLLGIPAVAMLRDAPEFADISHVWPFETGFALPRIPPGTPLILHAEIWPGVVRDKLDLNNVPIKDQAEVRAMVKWLAELDAANELLPLFGPPAGLSPDRVQKAAAEEGWIFGSGLSVH